MGPLLSNANFRRFPSKDPLAILEGTEFLCANATVGIKHIKNDVSSVPDERQFLKIVPDTIKIPKATMETMDSREKLDGLATVEFTV